MLRIEWMYAESGNAGDGVFLIRKTKAAGEPARKDTDVINALLLLHHFIRI
jgi:hypothetical protein